MLFGGSDCEYMLLKKQCSKCFMIIFKNCYVEHKHSKSDKIQGSVHRCVGLDEIISPMVSCLLYAACCHGTRQEMRYTCIIGKRIAWSNSSPLLVLLFILLSFGIYLFQ